MAKKREWSRAFTPKGSKLVNINFSGVPTTLRQKFQAKCRKAGKSQRNLVLNWIRNWVERDDPTLDRPTAAPVDEAASSLESGTAN